MSQVRRRQLLLAGSLLFAVAMSAHAQQSGARRIGFLSGPTPTTAMMDAFREGLRERGYVEGRSIQIDWRTANGKDELLPALAEDLVNAKVDVIVTFSGAAAMSAKRATATVPVVFTQVGDPVAEGIVPSLAHPGGNVTGLSRGTPQLAGKRLQVTKEAIPKARSFAILSNPENRSATLNTRETANAAKRLRIQVHEFAVHEPNDIERAFAAIAKRNVNVLVLAPGPFIFSHRLRIIDLATKARIPVVGWDSELVDSGALISYGPNRFEQLRYAAVYIDKIFNGAKPADLPVEEPTTYELVLNLKVARALGIKIPASVMQRADRVLE